MGRFNDNDRQVTPINGSEVIPAQGMISVPKVGGGSTVAGQDVAFTTDQLRDWIAAPRIKQVIDTGVCAPEKLTTLIRLNELDADVEIGDPLEALFDGWPILVLIRDDGTIRNVSWGSKWLPIGSSLPEITVSGKWLYVSAVYFATTDTLMVMSAGVQP